MVFFVIEFYLGGTFVKSNGHLTYNGGTTITMPDIDSDRLSRIEIINILKEDVGCLHNVKELWYLDKSCRRLDDGLREIKTDAEVLDLVGMVQYTNQKVKLYVILNDPILSQDVSALSSEFPILTQHSTSSSNHTLSVEDNHNGLVDVDIQQSLNGKNSDSSDDDYLCGSDSSSSGSSFHIDNDYDDVDDDLFEQNVDKHIIDSVQQMLGAKETREYNENLVFGDEKDDDSDELKSLHDSDSDGDGYPSFNANVDFLKPIQFSKGLKFASHEIFRKALTQYAIENGFDYYYLHNDSKRITAYCMKRCMCKLVHGRKPSCTCEKMCKWAVSAKKIEGDGGNLQLKSWRKKHDCRGKHHNNTKVTSFWLAEKYLLHYKDDPHWKLTAFQENVKRKYSVNISYMKAWRARRRAILNLYGDPREQYARVWDYALEIKKHNPGSTTLVKVESSRLLRPIFQRFYCCLDACKKGFTTACRPIIGLDGCHLKGAYSGQLLAAVSMDANDNIYPIAYAVVEIENKDTWSWFIEILLQDIGSVEQFGWTFMSDRQKGLLEALQILAPRADLRICVRHLHGNFKQKWPGQFMKDALWEAARASTDGEFKKCMESIKLISEPAYDYLMEANPKLWSRHAFSHRVKSDTLLNNMCECFNKYILETRDMPILTMLETIRRKLMKRYALKKEGMINYPHKITPRAMKKLDLASKESVKTKAHWAGNMKFEVDHRGKTYIVDLNGRTCSCNKWDISGIPCAHAVASILDKELDPDEFVDSCYGKEAFIKAYDYFILPMPSIDQWDKSPYTPPEPPNCKIQPGRPRKNRKRDQEEKKIVSERVPRKNSKNRCGRCAELGHNKKNCKNMVLPTELITQEPKKNVGRPKKSSTVAIEKPRKRKSVTKHIVENTCLRPIPTQSLDIDMGAIEHRAAEFEKNQQPRERDNLDDYQFQLEEALHLVHQLRENGKRTSKSKATSSSRQ